VLDKEEKEIKITHITDLKETEKVELKDIMASLEDLKPQNTEMEGEKSNIT
jgi:hypothetical protein